MTGEGGALAAPLRQSFSRAGLSHLLAISGLHLSIVAGFCFLVFQRALAFCPPIALGYALHKLAALWGGLLAFLYLLLSGAGLPAQRSWIMTAVHMGGIVLDRRVISLRTLALGALCILLRTPEALLSASFQLSFTAVTGLVVCYEKYQGALATWIARRAERGRSYDLFYRVVFYVMGCGFSSLVASLVTAPFIMVFFHQINPFGLLSNLLAVPLVTFCVMPLGVCYALACLLGGGGVVAPLLHVSLVILVKIAVTVGAWPGAALGVPVGAPWGLGIFILGGLWVCLWASSIRWAGLVLMVSGSIGLLTPHVPDFWVHGPTKVVAYYDKGSHILWFSSLKRARFLRALWGAEAGGAPGQQMPAFFWNRKRWMGKKESRETRERGARERGGGPQHPQTSPKKRSETSPAIPSKNSFWICKRGVLPPGSQEVTVVFCLDGLVPPGEFVTGMLIHKPLLEKKGGGALWLDGGRVTKVRWVQDPAAQRPWAKGVCAGGAPPPP
jgi:competence protein ComEC